MGRGKRAVLLLSAALLRLALPGARAEEPAEAVAMFPQSDQLFHRLLGDPRQAQTSLRYYRRAGFNLADVALGNTWGMTRWEDALGWRVQWNVEGMAYSRFRLSGGINEFQTVDFFANLPVEARRGAWSGRLTLFHESSHLGDDYIRRTRDLGFRYSIEGLRLVASWDAHPAARLYAGGMGLIHAVPIGQKGSLQAGFELKGPRLMGVFRQPADLYFAQDFQWAGRSAWNTASKTELGLRIARHGALRALRVHVGYSAGPSYFSQFYRFRESYFDIGTSFDF